MSTRIRSIGGLQWGHASSGVETRLHAEDVRVGCRASMGPRLLRRGNVAIQPEGIRAEARFNGATPPQAWKPGAAGIDRPRAGGFNGATPPQAWKHRTLRPRASAMTCFNGATPPQAWKRSRRKNGRRGQHRFNGATPPQAWKHYRRPNRQELAGRFNGATPPQAWKPTHGPHTRRQVFLASMGPRLLRRGNLPKGAGALCKINRLQWGHASSGVETWW